MPDWARRSNRAIDKIVVPRLSAVAPGIFDHLRPLTVVLIVRPILAAILFFFSAAQGWWPVAIVSTWVVYGGGLTAIHHLIHSGMGLSPRWRRFWLSALGMLVVESGHALQVTHLAHHRGDPKLADPEGFIENVGWLGLPLASIRFRYRLALWGLKHSPRPKRVVVEMTVHAVLHLSSLALLFWWPDLWIYLSLLHVASFSFAALAGKGPQTNFGREVATPYVRVISRFARLFLFSHDRHLEHHMYPKVPLPRLRQLDPMLQLVWDDLNTVDVRLQFLNRISPVPNRAVSAIEQHPRSSPQWVRTGVGTVSNSCGGPLGHVLRVAAGLPRGTACAAMAIQTTPDGEIWQRSFAHRTRTSYVAQEGNHLRERVFLVDLLFERSDSPDGGELKLVGIGRGWLRVPSILRPDISASVQESAHTALTVVEVSLPFRLGRLQYEAHLNLKEE